MSSAELVAALRKVDEACPCRKPDSHSGLCGEFLCPCYCSHHPEHTPFKQRTVGTLMDQPCRWPGHAAARELAQATANYVWVYVQQNAVGYAEIPMGTFYEKFAAILAGKEPSR